MSDETWQLTIVRLRGLHFLRPERSWRPIVTVVVGHHSEQLTVLGCDGQNVNMKECFYFREVDNRSRVEIHVWRKPESKKKGKKRQLAASTALTLGELLQKQGASTQTELPLSCMNLAGKRTAKGQPQKCATIIVRLSAHFCPSSSSSSRPSSPSTSVDERMSCSIYSGRASETLISEYSRSRDVAISDNRPSQLRRRRIRAYKIGSDESSDDSSAEESEFAPDEYPYELEGEDYCPSEDRTLGYCDEDESDTKVVQMGTMSWIAFQLLPRFTDELRAPPSLSVIESIVNRFSPYNEMMEATSDAEYQNILDGLKMEWKWGMNILLGLCGLNATIFGFSPDVLFSVESPSKKAIAFSGVTSGLGLVVSFWYQFLHMGSTGAKFKHHARDTFGTYFCFCMCCRLPTFLMFLSSCALLVFMFLVAFEVWPKAVMIVAFFSGVLVSLQYLLFGAYRLVLGIRWMFKMIGMACARAIDISRPTLSSPASTTTKSEDSDAETKKDPEKGSGVIVEIKAVEDEDE